jgi:uncharacterized protein DUF3667
MAKSASASKCRNCGTKLRGDFCSHCGQEVREASSPIWEASAIFFQQTFGTDARLWSTLRKLMIQPGVLTQEFLEGKQRRSLHPMRLFLIASVLAMLTPDISFGEDFVAPEGWSEPAPVGASLADRFTLGKQRILELAENLEFEEMISFAVEINQKYLLWCLLLTQLGLVLVLKILRWRRFLYDHLIFVMHFASFAYFSDMIFRTFEIRSLVGGIPLVLIQSGYCAFAFQRVYATQWKRLPRAIRFVLDLAQGLVVFAAMSVILKLLIQLATVYHVMPTAS